MGLKMALLILGLLAMLLLASSEVASTNAKEGKFITHPSYSCKCFSNKR